MNEYEKNQAKINKLHEKQAEIREAVKAKYLEEILKLDWLKGKTVYFESMGWVAAGLPAYTLYLRDVDKLLEEVLDFGNNICLYGNHGCYENNMLLKGKSFSDNGPFRYRMETSNHQTLCDFITQNELKIYFEEHKQKVYGTILKNLAYPIA